MRKSVDGFGARLQRLILPAHCLLCGLDGAAARDLCQACADDLLRNRSACPRCALPLAAAASICGECLRQEPPFARAFAPFVYGHPLDLLVGNFKFGRSLAAGRVLAELWLDAVEADAPALPELFIPVPLHRERGFNQALELARPLARALGVALADGALARSKATPGQAALDAKTRRQNLRGAFEFLGVARPASAPTHVALIDDVMTTGSTLRECARTLRRAGIARVDVWALARAPKSR